MHKPAKSIQVGAQLSRKTIKQHGFDFAVPEWHRDFYSNNKGQASVHSINETALESNKFMEIVCVKCLLALFLYVVISVIILLKIISFFTAFPVVRLLIYEHVL